MSAPPENAPQVLPRPTALTWAVVALSALYGFFVLVRPAWGLTFCMDDWEQLTRLRQTPWPARWLAIAMEHWPPIMWVLLDVKDRLFGVHHDPFLVWSLCAHVLNVALLARLLHLRTGSEPAAAIAAAAFGLTTHAREVVWWQSCSSWIPGFSLALLGFIALERHRHGRSIVPAALAALLAPMAIGAGIVVGPALAVEAALVLPAGRRLRAAGAVLLAWGLYLALFAFARSGHAVDLYPREGEHVLRALQFFADMIGSGYLGGLVLSPMGRAAHHGLTFALLYAAGIGGALVFSGSEVRRRIISAHVYLGLCFAIVAVSRWSFPPGQATSSRYQYFPALTWTTLVAFGVAAAWRASKRQTLVAAVVALAVLAVGHAGTAFADRQPYSPPIRALHPAYLDRLERAVASAKGPVFDAPLPFPVTQRTTHVSHVLALRAPGLRATYTNVRAAETVAPFLADPVLVDLAREP